MKRLFATAISLVMFSNLAMAQSHDEQINLELEAVALAEVAQGNLIDNRSFLGFDFSKPFGFVNKLKEQVESIKDTLITTFDEDGNGKIDPGTETENFKAGIQSIVMIIADTNQNGKIDAEDLASLGQLALNKIQEAVLTRACPTVVQQAEASGSFLQFRPVLSKLYDICLAQGTGE